MNGVNKTIMLGVIKDKPEFRQFETSSKLSFQIVITKEWVNKDGDKGEKTQTHRVAVWGDKLVSTLDKHLFAGSVVFVSGSLENRSYDDRTGNKKWMTEIVVNGWDSEITVISSPPHGGGRDERDDDRGDDRGGGDRGHSRGRRDTPRDGGGRAPAQGGRGDYRERGGGAEPRGRGRQDTSSQGGRGRQDTRSQDSYQGGGDSVPFDDDIPF